ncbi:MAG: hypothetical protein HY674_22690 [Chloroflexi bacterium]|nr:hypothetical protein [Chloroflexota bacterium]
MINLFRKTRWAVFNCLTGEFITVEKLPFEMGSGDGVDLKLNGEGVLEKHCAISQVKGFGICLVKKDELAQMFLNGVAADFSELKTGADFSLKIGSCLLAIRGGRDLEDWRRTLDQNEWTLFDAAGNAVEGPLPLPDLCRMARQRQRDLQAIALPKGLTMGFYLHQVLEVAGSQMEESHAAGVPLAALDSTLAGSLLLDYDLKIEAPAGQGALTCPVCWLKFDEGDIMHVAVHDSLRGDPVLGEDAPQRFHATRFNNRGQALDAFGLPCTDMACPHCRRALPPGFVDVQHHILSIVGDQSAGKSYYLSVLIKILPASLYQHFSVLFQDADPAGNAMLNDMKKSLFSAQSPEEARLVKTQLEGIMYERLPRYGRTVALPKPFVFFIASIRDPAQRCAAIFYDNAGEHFQPGRDSADSPGAQHVASSAGIFFLFDPFNNPEFRRRIAGQPDPQFEKPILDQQDVILSELKVRIKKLLKLDMGQKIATPLAVMIGKCDAWMHLLGEQPFRNPLETNRLNLEAVRHNSERVRNLMLEVCPAVVANAEGISESVMFFPVSAFGHPPVKIGPGDYVPDPRQLKPILVEIPPLWVLSQVTPGLVPAS